MHTCLHLLQSAYGCVYVPCVISAPVPHEGAWRHVGWFIGLICSMIITPDIPQRSRAATYHHEVTLMHTHMHYISTVSRFWMRLAIAWSLYAHPHSLTHTITRCYRWGEPPGTRSPTLRCCGVLYWWRISEWEREITWALLCAGRQGVVHVYPPFFCVT